MSNDTAEDGRELHRHPQEAGWLDQRDALVELACEAVGDDFAEAIRRITEINAHVLGVARVSVWRLSEDRRSIHCVDLYEPATGRHSAGMELPCDRYPEYFRALGTMDVIDAHDARSDPRTRDLRGDYLDPLGITSMLDVPIRLGRAEAGVLCHEHTGKVRHWRPDEASYALAVANMASLAFERSARRQSEAETERTLRRLNEAQRIGQIGDWECDVDSQRITWSPQAYDIFGRDPALGPPRNFEENLALFDAASRDTVNAKVREAIALGEAQMYEATARRPDGREVHIQVVTMPRRDARGRVVSLFGTLQDITDRKRVEEQLIHLARYDALTDLPNRVLFKDRLAVAIAQAQRLGHRLAVLFLDVDRFKNVNDSFGHDIGDRLLRDVARRLLESVRSSDTVSRQGGDEFIILLPEIDSEKAAAHVADKVIAAMADPISIGEAELLVSASIGIACFPENGGDAEALLRNADAAMYAAKAAGRGHFQFYSAEMNARAHERLMLESDLRRAIERGELFLQYQPQVALGSGAVIGMEALVRWRHPARGIVPPMDFIPIAEESGLIVAIGDCVLNGACQQQARWVREGIARGPIGVNVSASQFRQPGFVQGVVLALERAGLAPEQLELEVTESVVMHGVDIAREKLAALDELGVGLAIDDFGTGYSSLSYLKQFPLDRLKIDRSFISGLPEDKESGAIAQAIISMGRSLDLKVIAEGIETAEQAAFLASLGCDEGQGFLFSQPLTAEDCAGMLRGDQGTLPCSAKGRTG